MTDLPAADATLLGEAAHDVAWEALDEAHTEHNAGHRWDCNFRPGPAAAAVIVALESHVAALVEAARADTAERTALAIEGFAAKLRADEVPGLAGAELGGERYRRAAAMHYDYAARIARETR